jgi:predicted amidohydrolase YtcJ
MRGAIHLEHAVSTSSIRIAVAVLGVSLALGCRSAGTSAERTADTIYTGGDIVTVNDAQPTAEALAVKDGRIVAVGTRAEVELVYRGPATKRVDLAGKTLLPSFIDAHGHYITSLTLANRAKVYAPPAGPGKDVPSIIAAIEAFRIEHRVPKGELIQAYGYDESAMPDGRVLNRDDLDVAFPDNPVLVGRVSTHGGVMNSAALETFGSSATPPEPTREQEVESARAGQMLYAAAGITLAQEGAAHVEDLEVMQRAAAGADLIDVVAYPVITDLDAIVAANPVDTWGRYDKRLKIGGVEITIDGSPQAKSAFFTTPYLTGGPGGRKTWRGELTFPQETINRMVKKVYDMDVPLLVDCNGDGAIDAFLTAYEYARAGEFSRLWNVTTIHTQFVRRDQLEKFVRYKIRPSFCTLDIYDFAETDTAHRGKAQARYISPMRDAIDMGLRPTNPTDFSEAPFDPMFTMWSAVNRMSRAGAEIGPGQRISPLEALKSMTLWAAEQYEEQASKGSLEPGKLADLVILDKNPLKVDRKAIKDIKVVETIKEGRTVYAAGP